jgi:high-affinity Fe2+/Pb2+ permease
MYNGGFYMSGYNVHRVIVGVAAAAFIGYGIYRGMKKLGGRSA